MDKLPINKRFSNFALRLFFPGIINEADAAFRVLESAYQKGAMIKPPHIVESELREASSQLADLILRMRNSIPLAGSSQNLVNGPRQFTQSDRNRLIQLARSMSLFNSNIAGATKLWWAFGMGQRIEIGSKDDAANKVLREFWTSKRNASILSVSGFELLNRAQIEEGETIFVIFYSTTTGKATIRTIESDSVNILTEPDDPKTPVFYVVETAVGKFTAYPDYNATPEMLDRVGGLLPKDTKRLDQDDPRGNTLQRDGKDAPATKVVVIRGAMNQVKIDQIFGEYSGTAYRGTPAFMQGFDYAQLLEGFVADRAAVAKKAAMFTDNVTVEGGSRVVNQIASRLQSGLVTGDELIDSNPPPVAGSDWIQNDKAKREWQSRDTNAGSARFDGWLIAGQMGVATAVPMFWQGFPNALNNRATAQEIKVPFFQQMQANNIYWQELFESVGAAVLDIENKFKEREMPTINVITNTPVSSTFDDLNDLMKTIVSAAKDLVITFGAAEKIMLELLALALNKMGVKDVREFLSEPSEEGGAQEGGAMLDQLQKLAMAALAEIRAGQKTEKAGE